VACSHSLQCYSKYDGHLFSRESTLTAAFIEVHFTLLPSAAKATIASTKVAMYKIGDIV